MAGVHLNGVHMTAAVFGIDFSGLELDGYLYTFDRCVCDDTMDDLPPMETRVDIIVPSQNPPPTGIRKCYVAGLKNRLLQVVVEFYLATKEFTTFSMELADKTPMEPDQAERVYSVIEKVTTYMKWEDQGDGYWKQSLDSFRLRSMCASDRFHSNVQEEIRFCVRYPAKLRETKRKHLRRAIEFSMSAYLFVRSLTPNGRRDKHQISYLLQAFRHAYNIVEGNLGIQDDVRDSLFDKNKAQDDAVTLRRIFTHCEDHIWYQQRIWEDDENKSDVFTRVRLMKFMAESVKAEDKEAASKALQWATAAQRLYKQNIGNKEAGPRKDDPENPVSALEEDLSTLIFELEQVYCLLNAPPPPTPASTARPRARSSSRARSTRRRGTGR
ncbi:hypothetical protein E4U21_006417 [Claviceps maximensis]|nr:hypothetical protein E4U21_006417 [Claviceps maximensis]